MALKSRPDGPRAGLVSRLGSRRGGDGPRRRCAPRRRLAVAGLVAVSIAAALAGFRVRINASGSLPRGLYRLSDRPPVRSALVLLCPPPAAARLARVRGYLPAGGCPGGVQPLGKLVLAMGGDRVEVSARGLAVEGRAIPWSGASAADSAGRPLRSVPRGVYRLAPGELWLHAPHPRSFDSRFFGPVPASRVLGTLVPLLTRRSARLEAAAALARSLGRPLGGRRPAEGASGAPRRDRSLFLCSERFGLTLEIWAPAK
jgi:conjugative transfer signal peptidase TraF